MIANLTKLVGASVFGQLIYFCLTPIISRNYTPEQFGTLGSYLVIASILAILSSLRYEIAYFRDRKTQELYVFLGLSLILISSFIFALSVSLFSAFIEGVQYPVALILLFISASLMNFFGQIATADKLYTEFSVSKFVQFLVQGVAAVILGAISFDQGLLYSVILSQAIFFLMISRKIKFSFECRQAFVLFLAKLRFCIRGCLIALIQNCAPHASLLFIFFYLDTESVGLYFFLVQVISTPMTLVRRSLLQIVTAEFSGERRYDLKVSLHRMVKSNFFKFGVVLLVLFTLVLLILGERIFGTIFGSNWRQAGAFSWLVFLYFSLDTFLQPFNLLMSTWGSEKIHAILESARLLFVFIVPSVIFIFISPSLLTILLSVFSVMMVFNVLYLYLILRRHDAPK